jgi:hypothetical protein
LFKFTCDKVTPLCTTELAGTVWHVAKSAYITPCFVAGLPSDVIAAFHKGHFVLVKDFVQYSGGATKFTTHAILFRTICRVGPAKVFFLHQDIKTHTCNKNL